MSDIVDRLRKMAEADYYGHDQPHFVPPEECADEIDRLREALERIAHIRHEVFVRNPQTLREAKDIARAALAKEGGK